MESNVNKREGERIEVEVPVRLEHGQGVSRNVSTSGIYFVTDLSFAEGDVLRFTMAFHYAIPGRRMNLDCQAKVMRVEPLGDQVGVAARIVDFTWAPIDGRDGRNVTAGTSSLH